MRACIPGASAPDRFRTMMGRVLSAAVLLLAGATPCAYGQAYPAKPLRVIIPFVAGGVLDVLMRNLNQMTSEALGQPILIDNRPGASSQIMLSACARSAPDGYTLCASSGEGFSFGPFLFPSLPYNTESDFAPITNLVIINSVIAANRDMPFNSVKELVAYARERPGRLNWGSFGVASTPHVYLEWIKKQSGVDITHVPYKGGSNPVGVAMLAGDIQASYFAMGPILGQIRSGKMKALAVTTPQRSPYLPNVPTLAEEGLDPGVTAWFGLFAPARTPGAIVDRLNAEYVRALRDANFRERFLAVQAYDGAGSTPAEFAEFLKRDRVYAGRVVTTLGLKPDRIDAPAAAPPGPTPGRP